MSVVRRKTENKISQMVEKIQQLKADTLAAEAELKGMKEILKFLPKEGDKALKTTLRVGSLAEKAYKALSKNKTSMHVSDLLLAIHRANNKKNRLSLSSVLAQYVRKVEIFSRPAPNTFGLMSWDTNTSTLDDFKGGE